MCKDFPYPYGNYFSMYLNGVKLPDDMKIDKTQHNCDWFSICNFNYENYEEACQRFLTDNLVEITIFKPENLGWLVIAITDERIPQDWYHMWSEMSGYCNGGIHGKTYEEVVRTLGKKFGGDENFKMTTTCDICGKEIIGVENFIDAGDKVVCSEDCKQKAIGQFRHWQETESHNWRKP